MKLRTPALFALVVALLTSFSASAQTYNPIDDLAWSADGIYLAIAHDSGQIIVRNSVTEQTVWSTMSGRFVSVDWHPTNTSLLAYASLEQGVNIVDVSTGNLINQFPGHPNTFSVAFSPDGHSIVTGHSTPGNGPQVEGYLCVIDVATGLETVTFERVNQRVTDAEWNPTGDLIAGINEGIVVIWDATTGNIVQYLSELTEETDEIGTFVSGFIQAFAFSPNGNQIATARGVRVSFWNGGAYNKVLETAYLYGVNDVDWSPDGAYLAAASGIDRSVYVLDVITGNIINTIPTGTDTAVVKWDPSGSKLVFGGQTSIPTIVLDPLVPSTACSTTIPASDTTALISAITSANNASTPQTLCLTSSTYTLTAVDNTTDGANGLPSIVGDITIVGNGASIIFKSGSGFEVVEGGALTLEHVTVIGDMEP